jgi:Transposase IS116/IS110/IS902 family
LNGSEASIIACVEPEDVFPAADTISPVAAHISPTRGMCVRSYQARSTRFPNRGHFASWTGTAPIDVSSGDRQHHRLSRGGNRQINMVLHMMAVVQLRNPTEGRAYYDRKLAAGKSPNEAMRCP